MPVICEFCENPYDLDDGWFKVCPAHGDDAVEGNSWFCICEDVSAAPLSNCEVPGCEGQHKAICQCRICPECFEKIKGMA